MQCVYAMKKKTVIAVDVGGGKSQSLWYTDVSPTLATTHYGEPVVFEYEENEDGNNSTEGSEEHPA